jgi:CubicO group peptidase (beta-lactamase class C family)
MLKYLDEIGCSGASLTISSKGVPIYSRGYGWRDKKKRVPLQPDTLIGIASCEKPITAAAIRQLARNRKLDLEASLF